MKVVLAGFWIEFYGGVFEGNYISTKENSDN